MGADAVSAAQRPPLLCPGAPDAEPPDDGAVVVDVLGDAPDLAAGAEAGAAVCAGAAAGGAGAVPLFWPGADGAAPAPALAGVEPVLAVPRPAIGSLVPDVVFTDLR
ncbi:MAG: hypothetical protein JWN65_3682 [Solirubrobacterales bacterium]|nr:hypothetical protein [Solirubrobacterales bacterium]